MFIDEQYVTARDKEFILADWTRFIRNGFREADFTEVLYKYLSLYCSFIAHTDRHRFWETYFDATAGMLAVFMNQFGGTKVSAETRWTDWQGGNTADLKKALIASAVDAWPAFESVLTGYALERYEAEKWQDAQTYAGKLPQRMQNAESLSHMSLIFELVFPFEIYLDCLHVDEELRRRLTFGQDVIAEPSSPPPGVAAARWNLNGKAAEVVTVQQVSLFGEQQQPCTGVTEAETALARRIAALSTTEVLAGIPRSTVIIEGQKILFADK